MILNKVKVLVVDDSMIARKYLARILEESGEIEVVGFARDGLEAIEKVKEVKPDVVTLDIEMPKLNGLEALKRIMEENPVPVIMVSTLTTDGAKETLEALRLGAVDYVSKNDVLSFKTASKQVKDLLVKKIVEAKRSQFRVLRRRPRIAASVAEEMIARKVETKPLAKRNIEVVAIAASTGGPVALERVFSKFPRLRQPVLIVQHMPKTFTGVFAKSLDRVAPITIKEAEDGEPLKGGVGYLAPGGLQMTVEHRGSGYVIRVSDQPKTIYTPNADVMFTSVAENFGDKSLCVIMTGMGDDGYRGLKKVHEKGGVIIAQDKNSCVVWGMPRKPTQEGLADVVADVDDIPLKIAQIAG